MSTVTSSTARTLQSCSGSTRSYAPDATDRLLPRMWSTSAASGNDLSESRDGQDPLKVALPARSPMTTAQNSNAVSGCRTRPFCPLARPSCEDL